MDFLSLRSLWSILIIYIIIVIILCSGQNRLNIPILYYYFHLFDHFYLTCEIWLINVASHFWVLHEVNYYFFDVYTQLCLRCNFYWSIVDLQCFVSFRYTTKWFRGVCVCIYIYIWSVITIYIYIHTHTHFTFFSIIVYYKILNRVPCAISRSLFIYFIYSNVYLLIWLTSLNIIISMSIHVAANGIISFLMVE